MKIVLRNSILALLAIICFQGSAHASGKGSNSGEIQNLNLVCIKSLPEGSQHAFLIYNIIVEPESIVSIPEKPIRGPQYSGEYLAIVKITNIEDTEDQILYSGRKEFSLKKIDETNYSFISKKLKLKLECSIEGIASGGGAFSGSN